MEEKELKFDRKKHVCYSSLAKQIILEHILRHYSENKINDIWENIQRQYVEFLKDLPFLGGSKSNHNATGGTYDCIALFAYYEVLENRPSLDEIYEMNLELISPSFEGIGKIINVNKPLLLRLMNIAFAATAKKDKKHENENQYNYIMRTEPYNKNAGVRYRFERCPIAEFAKKYGYLHLMPAICNADYPIFEAMNGGLIRRHTCANSDVCDYWIVGSESEYLKKYPRKTDENGYWYNEI